ncbi:MAG: nickel/cobalt efflux transporter RcnA [Verrucomicrobiaceae bacterium]|nr:nickel/cobalt efflux transporter RcnA [Verrucomicrobiaceae bacterium]
MTDIEHLIQSGSVHVWLYIPVAILLGALHGLEPGHSKTMMAAFIIAIRGTVWQAVLLGLSAAISHSLLIWLLAALALNYGSKWSAETIEPYLQLASAVMILALAAWMFVRTRREVREAAEHGHGHAHSHERNHGHHHGHSHGHHRHHHDHGSGHGHARDDGHSHDHAHPVEGGAGEMHPVELPSSLSSPGRFASLLAKKRTQGPHGGVMLDTGHGWLEIAIFEDGVPPRFRIHPCRANGDAVPLPRGTRLTIETARLDGSTQLFKFEPAAGFWESAATVPEPHEFTATLTMGHDDHAHTYRLKFSEAHEHEHDPDEGHPHEGDHGRAHAPVIEEIKLAGDDVYQDAHERAHAEDIARRFANRSVTTPQIVLFGITGGLMPCPAAFTILLVCLQLKKVALGFAIVGAFSFGLALTMVTVGALAAWSVQKAQRRFTGFSELMRKAPYVSCALLVVLALVMAWSGWTGLHAHGHS